MKHDISSTSIVIQPPDPSPETNPIVKSSFNRLYFLIAFIIAALATYFLENALRTLSVSRKYSNGSLHNLLQRHSGQPLIQKGCVNFYESNENDRIIESFVICEDFCLEMNDFKDYLIQLGNDISLLSGIETGSGVM